MWRQSGVRGWGRQQVGGCCAPKFQFGLLVVLDTLLAHPLKNGQRRSHEDGCSFLISDRAVGCWSWLKCPGTAEAWFSQLEAGCWLELWTTSNIEGPV